SPEVVREGGELLGPARRDDEVVLDAEAAALGPVDPGLDRENHALCDRPAPGLMGVGRLVRTGSDSVRNRMSRLPGIAGLVDPGQTRERRSARSTSVRAVPSPWTCPSHIAAAWLSVIPGRRFAFTCPIATAAISFAIRIRSSSCGVLIARASFSSGVASEPPGQVS